MLQLWIRIGMLAGGLAAVVYAQMYLSDLASSRHDSDNSLMTRPLEVETQALNDAAEETKRNF